MEKIKCWKNFTSTGLWHNSQKKLMIAGTKNSATSETVKINGNSGIIHAAKKSKRKHMGIILLRKLSNNFQIDNAEIGFL